MMLSLIRKDVRQSLWPVIFAWTLLFAPVTIWLGVMAIGDEPVPRGEDLREELAEMLIGGVFASLISASALTAVAFAKERRERTMDHLVTMPIRRGKVVASKGMVALAMSILPVVVGVVLVAVAAGAPTWEALASPSVHVDRAVAYRVWLGVSAWLFLLGGGWFCSSLLRSEVLSAAVPLMLLIAILLFISRMPSAETYDRVVGLTNRDWLFYTRSIGTLGSLGASGVVAGTVMAMVRKSA